MGFPIRTSPGQSLFNGSPELIAAGHVLHRLPAPRHPPYAFSNLTIKFSQDKTNAASVRLSKIGLVYKGISPRRGEISSKANGADRNRTGDLRRAKPALSQLSYSPSRISISSSLALDGMVGLSGFEPPTSRLSGVRSYQLSYRPNTAFVGPSARRRALSPTQRIIRKSRASFPRIFALL